MSSARYYRQDNTTDVFYEKESRVGFVRSKRGVICLLAGVLVVFVILTMVFIVLFASRAPKSTAVSVPSGKPKSQSTDCSKGSVEINAGRQMLALKSRDP